MGSAAARHNPIAEIVLITDYPNLHQDFCGKIILYDRGTSNPWIKKYISKNREKLQIAGGYWLFTLERLFALSVLLREYDDFILVHIESDVYLNMPSEIMASLSKSTSITSVPRYSQELGIASIFFAPSKQSLADALTALRELVKTNTKIEGDMELLGLALKLGVLAELTTNPKDPLVLQLRNGSDTKVIFDGAAYGQYLFGQDPFHTNGQRISGFINENSGQKPDLVHYELKINRDGIGQSLFVDGIQLLNVHVHAKLPLNEMSCDDKIWKRALDEANGITVRIPDEYVADRIHTQKIFFINRFRIARKRGLGISIAAYATKKLKGARP